MHERCLIVLDRLRSTTPWSSDATAPVIARHSNRPKDYGRGSGRKRDRGSAAAAHTTG